MVTNDFPPRRGGIESFVVSLCERLPQDQVVVYTASMPGDHAVDASLSFPVYRDRSSTLLPTPVVTRRVADAMRRHACDRVVFGASAPLGLLAPALRRAGAERLVALTHGHEVWWARVPLARRLLRQIGDSVDVMTCVSQWCRTQIGPALSSEASARMRRLSPGVDTGLFFPGCGGAHARTRLGVPDCAPLVVCVARMIRRKGQDVLVRAWPSVLTERPEAQLLLVGDGPAKRVVQRLARRLGVAGSVLFAGSVPWREVPALIDAGDVFAMPCRTRLLGLEPEAFGIVLLEAQACGLPVVAGDSGGAPEAVLDRGGVVVGPRSPDQVARAVLSALERGRRPADEVRAVMAEHSWDRVAGELGEMLRL